MPMKSQKQRRYLWKFHPELAKEFEKETPKGKKLPMYAPKRKSAIEKIRLILAQESPEKQYANIDVNAAEALIPNVIQLIDSANVNEIKKHMINNYKISPEIAEKATSNFVVRIYKEEKNKRMQQVVDEVGKKLGVDPSKISDISIPTTLPPLPGTKGILKRKIILAKIIKSDLEKKDISSYIEKVDNMSISEKLKNLYNFLSNRSVSEAVDEIMNFISTLKTVETSVNAKLSEKVGIVSVLLWIVSLIITLGAAGSSDFSSRYVSKTNQAAEAKAMKLMLESYGAAGLTSALAHFLKKREEKNKKS